MTAIRIHICARCSTVFIGERKRVICNDCLAILQKRRCYPLYPDLWDPVLVAHHNPGWGALADIQREIKEG